MRSTSCSSLIVSGWPMARVAGSADCPAFPTPADKFSGVCSIHVKRRGIRHTGRGRQGGGFQHATQELDKGACCCEFCYDTLLYKGMRCSVMDRDGQVLGMCSFQTQPTLSLFPDSTCLTRPVIDLIFGRVHPALTWHWC